LQKFNFITTSESKGEKSARVLQMEMKFGRSVRRNRVMKKEVCKNIIFSKPEST